MAKRSKGKMSDLKQDPNNFNLGTARGRELLGESLEANGIGRGVVVAADGTIIAGNKTVKRIQELGLDPKIIRVETDGTELVVVKRTDIEGREAPTFHRLALMDNLVGAENIKWDPLALNQTFTPEEVGEWSRKLEGKMRAVIPNDHFTTEQGSGAIELADYPDESEAAISMISIFLTSANEAQFHELAKAAAAKSGATNTSDAVASAIRWTAKNHQK